MNAYFYCCHGFVTGLKNGVITFDRYVSCSIAGMPMHTCFTCGRHIMSADDVVDYLVSEIKSSVWEKNNIKHIYPNTKALCDLYGLKCRTYSSGRVSEATLNDAPITNSRATRIITMFQLGKFHYNCNTNRFDSKTMPKAMVNKLKRLFYKNIDKHLNYQGELC